MRSSFSPVAVIHVRLVARLLVVAVVLRASHCSRALSQKVQPLGLSFSARQDVSPGRIEGHVQRISQTVNVSQRHTDKEWVHAQVDEPVLWSETRDLNPQ